MKFIKEFLNSIDNRDEETEYVEKRYPVIEKPEETNVVAIKKTRAGEEAARRNIL